MTDIAILGIDPSTTVVGWCWWRSCTREVLSGQIDFRKSKRDAWRRLETFSAWLDDLASRIYDATATDVIMACEETSGSHANPDTDRKMGASMGVVLAVAARHDMLFVRVHPSKVKKTGLCKSSSLAMAAAAAFVEKDKVGPDEADAIGVTQAALVILRERGLWQGHR